MNKEFLPNLNPVKRKKLIFEESSSLFTLECSSLTNVCCHVSEIDIDTKDIYCIKCYEIIVENDVLNLSKYENEKVKQANIPIWRRDHDRARFTGYTLEYMSGYYIHEYVDRLWLYIMEEVPNKFKWFDVYKVGQKYRIGDDWLGFGTYIGLKPKLNRMIVDYADKYTNYKIGIYRVSYLYLLYKFTQLFAEDEHDCRFIPLKGQLKWILKMDHWWKKFCLKEWFQYKPTRIYELTWNKKEKIYNLRKNLDEELELSLKEVQYKILRV